MRFTTLLFCAGATLLAQTSAPAPAPGSDSAKRSAASAADGSDQQAAKRPKFDVASVKLSPDCDPRKGNDRSPSPASFRLVCRTLRQMIQLAYGNFEGANFRYPRLEIVGGPHWVDTDVFIVDAKTKGAAPYWQKASVMLQALLEEKFQVKVHTEPRDTPVFAMTVVKSGTGLKSVREDSCVVENVDDPQAPRVRDAPAPGQPTVSTPVGPRTKYCGMGGFASKGPDIISDAYGVTMAEYAANTLSSRVGRKVIDRTGLTGLFDVHLEFARDSQATIAGGSGAPEAATPGAAPGIIQAVERQLGLKLTATRAPVDVIVIDRAEKPTEN